ncbi:TPA: hypothetical protein I8Y86_002523 [Legionella pneumophila]|uniref:Uncharacterized protein n=1 Tax=Legionella pneumophila subsp. pascullei TaxID=91890 RepID=A0AAX2IT59_LEGPN|nr:hypothetical protein [Legionella pneumophila]HAT9115407.1 hypothetical protein [Legionella pneumophila subsp. pneumophila]AMP91781.1 hypothetical protein AXF36_03860 [Legionella pneumophila subsp. pascullei]APF05594.1 hypothetical protein BIZ51_04100 [Legionella pneumophila subsp. fraseri]SQG89597.1 Uncharacterised protein [Legionella pneumophila subsp. pascullei]VEH05026.1 Uncharacterised protein [Legionella pneumophila subsp. pascullei]
MDKIELQRNTLLFVHVSTHFKEMIRVARLMKQNGTYNPYIFFYVKYEGVKRDIEQCQSEGVSFITYFDLNASRQSGFNLKLQLLRFFLKLSLKFLEVISYILKPFVFLFKCLFYFPGKFISTEKNQLTFKKNKRLEALLIFCYKMAWYKFPFFLPPISRAAYDYSKYMDRVLGQYQVKLLVFPEHNLFYFTQLIVYIGKKYKIPSIIVPFTIANTKEWAETFYNKPSLSLSKIYNKVLSIAFPHWVYCYKNRQMILPVDLILLHEMFRITPKNPWLLNSGEIDFLALESDAMKDYYISAGLEEKYLKATGALYNDELFRKLQDADSHRIDLYHFLDMCPSKPMILCALPPNQCDSRQNVIEFLDYTEIVKYLLEQLSHYAKEYNIIINLHPRINFSSVEFIKDYPVKIFYGDIAEIIPLSAIYVSVCSATIRMAISCGIPVINYDLYRYEYDDYDDLKGVITVYNRAEFSSILEKLAKEPGFYAQIKEAQLRDSEKWGQLDGKAGRNLLNEINLLWA